MATTVSLKPNAVEISGSTSGTTTLQATAVAGTTTLTLPAATDTLVGKATTDTLTNKTLTTPVISTISNTGTLTLPTSTDTLVGRATTDTLTNKTLTGAAMNGTLGATTPSTGAFTTTTASTSASATIFYPTVTSGTGIQMTSTGNNNGNWTIANNYGQMTIATEGTAGSLVTGSSQGAALFGNSSNVPAQFFTNNTVRATIDTSGNLLVGTTGNSTFPSRGYFVGSASFGGLSVSAPGSGAGYPVYFVDSNATSASQQMVHFDRGSSNVGNISTTNTTTTYTTASDYRLKNTITPITGALAKVVLLKPCTYKWNKDGSVGEGFIAHELQEVCPIAVYGTKDGIDADGKPDYQGVDTSFLVATLTAAIQEQQALITQLTARITALESA